MTRIRLALLLAIVASSAQAQSGVDLMDDHTFVHLMVDELELVDPGDENDLSWDMDISAGGDLHKLWFKSRGERSNSGTDKSEVQLLYSKALLPFWDLQAGVRRDLDPTPDRDWAVVSILGLAPRFFNVEGELFFAEGGQSGLRVRGEYELLLTQRLILSPELEVVAYGRDEPGRLLGSGFGEAHFDVRLRYEVKREIAPYVGLSWHQDYGHTRNFGRLAGRDTSDLVLTIGFRGWF